MKNLAVFFLLWLLVGLIVGFSIESASLPPMPPLVAQKHKLEKLKFSFNPVQQIKAQTEIKKLIQRPDYKKQQAHWNKISEQIKSRLFLFKISLSLVITSVIFFAFKFFKRA